MPVWSKDRKETEKLEYDVLRARVGLPGNVDAVRPLVGRNDVPQQGRVELMQALQRRPVIEGDPAQWSAAANRQHLIRRWIVELDGRDSVAIRMMRDIRHGHETSQQPTGSPRQPVAELFDVGAAQRPITIDGPIAVVPRDQRYRPIVAGLVVQGRQILGRRLGGHYRVAALIDVVVDMEAEALGRVAIELPRTPAALGKFAFGEGQVHQVVGKTIASQYPDHIGQVGVTAVEGILQLEGVIQKSRHIAANGLIKQNRERRNRLRQRKHVWRRDRLWAGFRGGVELTTWAFSGQARGGGGAPT